MSARIGLEVHVELDTKTKLFCRCPRGQSFSCSVCSGHPGTRPRVSREAILLALRVAYALRCTVASALLFDRKPYLYPDLPKGYQITQYFQPIGRQGVVLVEEHPVHITEIHIEEDPAALSYEGDPHTARYAVVDDARSGSPLLEIVTAPDITSPRQARAFLEKLFLILKHVDAFSPESCIIKVDASISIQATEFTRVEIKGVSGFQEVQDALTYEIVRQKTVVRAGKLFKQHTRSWDGGVTRKIRDKESEDEYGFIPEPDIPAILVDESTLREARSYSALLPDELVRQFVVEGVSKEDAIVLVSEPHLTKLYVSLKEEAPPAFTARFLRREVLRLVKETGVRLSDITVEHLLPVLRKLSSKRLTYYLARQQMKSLVMKREVMIVVDKEQDIETACRETLQQHTDCVRAYIEGDPKALHFLIGQTVRKFHGTVRPQDIRAKLEEKMKKGST